MSNRLFTAFGMPYSKEDSENIEKYKDIVFELFQTFIGRGYRELSLDLVCDTLTVLKLLKLDNIETWNIIRRSPYVYGQNVEFIEDTINFILTGRRLASIDVWLNLIDLSEEKQPKIENKLLFEGRGYDLAVSWFRKENGFQDALITLQCLLFDPKKVNLNFIRSRNLPKY